MQRYSGTFSFVVRENSERCFGILRLRLFFLSFTELTFFNSQFLKNFSTDLYTGIVSVFPDYIKKQCLEGENTLKGGQIVTT